MKRTFYIALSFIICCLLKTQHIWIIFAPVFVSMLLFRFGNATIWEIPLACLACSVLETAFSDDIITLTRLIIPISAAIIGFISPKKLALFFPSAVCAIFLKNIYGVAAVWAVMWSTVHIYCILSQKRPFYKNINHKYKKSHQNS